MERQKFHQLLDLYAEAGQLFMTYNANIDAIAHVDTELEQLIEEETITPHLCQLITSRKELLSCIGHAMHHGEAAEVGMTPEMTKWIQQTLSADMRRMGGQIGIMANHLALLNCSPVVNIPFLSENQKALFDTDVQFVQNDTVVGWNAAETEQQVKENWIFEFEEGTQLDGIAASRTTRFIASSHMEEFRLDRMPYIDFPFSAAIISGFHSVEQEYADGTTASDVFAVGSQLVETLQERNVPTHVELAYRNNVEILQGMLDLASQATSIGLDEQEVMLLLQTVGEQELADAIHANGHAIEDILAGVQRLQQYIDTERIHLHGRHYFLTITQHTSIQPEQIRDAMEGAAVIAASYAMQDVQTQSDMCAGLDTSVNEDGYAVISAIAQALGSSDKEQAAGIFQHTDGYIIVTPNRYVAKPRAVVGLGDIISASIFAAEVAFLNREAT